MKYNPFKDNKILFLLSTWWYDGTSYKTPEFLKKEFGVESTRGEIEGQWDLGICGGDVHLLYQKFINKNIPYILLEHDVSSMRFGLNETTYQNDKKKIENAVAVIFTSEEHAEYYEEMKKKYNWHIPEYVIIHNKPLKKDIKFTPKEKLEGLHLVMAGGIVSKWINTGRTSYFNYKSFHNIYKKFIDSGWKVHIYPTKLSNANSLSEYKNIGCIIHNWVDGNKIYQEMSQYTAGIQANNDINTPKCAFLYAQSTRPNKLYDYLAAGIPTIGYNAGERASMIYRDKWGIVIDDLEPETLKAIPERLNKIKITKKMRNDNVLERERDKFEYIINVALKEAKNKDRKIYNIDKNPFRVSIKNPFEKKYPIKITVENKTPSPITRINRIFLPKSISEVFSVDKMDYKQLRAHINLIIKEVEV